MGFGSDERAQPIQVGFIILLSFLVLSLTLYQAVLIPQQNADVEYNHFQDVETDVAELRSDALEASSSEGDRSVDVELGTTYPPRLLALNPPPSTGTLETVNAGAVEISGLRDDELALCSTTGASSIVSRSLVYRPTYAEYDPPESLAYENTFVATTFRNGHRFGPQSFVDYRSGANDTIDLQVLTGSVQETSTSATTVELRASRRASRSYSPDSSFTVTVPSRQSPDQWETEILADETGNLESVGWANTSDASRVALTFAPGDYDVSCSVLGLNEAPAYVPPDTADDGSTGTGSDGEPGYGFGGESDYTSDTDTTTVSVANGVWQGVLHTDELVLSNGRTVYNTNQGANELEFEIDIENTTTEERYTLRFFYSKQPGNSPTKKVEIFDGTGNSVSASPTGEAVRAVIDNDTAYTGADLLDVSSYTSTGSAFNATLRAIKDMGGTDTDIVTSEVRGRVDLTVREEALFSAIQPRPSDDEDLEFVRVAFESPTNTSGWRFVDTEGTATSFPNTTLSGEVYFAADESAFETRRGFADDVVYPLSGELENASDHLRLLDSQDRTRDEVAYVDDNTSTTPVTDLGGWRLNDTDAGTVGKRLEQPTLGYFDNDTREDWERVDQSNFFVSPGPPKVAFVESGSPKTIKTISNESSTPTEFARSQKQIGILGPIDDLDGDGDVEVPFVDNNNRLTYAASDGSIEVLADPKVDQDYKALKNPVGVGTHEGDATPTIYYVNESNYLYGVRTDGSPTLVAPLLINGSGNEGTFKPAGVAALVDVNDTEADGGAADKEIVLFNQSAIAYLDEDASGDRTVRVRSLVGPSGTSIQIGNSKGVGAPLTFDADGDGTATTQIPVVNSNNYIHLVNESGATTRITGKTATGSVEDPAAKVPVAPRDWDGDGTPEVLFIDNQPSDGSTQQSLAVTELQEGGLLDPQVETVYEAKLKKKGVV